MAEFGTFGSSSTAPSFVDVEAARRKAAMKAAAKAAGVTRDDDDGGIAGFFGNLGGDIRGLTGIPAGLYAVGKSAVHDAGKAAGLTGGEYQLDDIGRAIAKDYAHTYGPLFSGEFKKFGRRLYAHPLGPILDAASLFTGGGALAGKAATKVATKTGSPSAMRIAGLQRVDEITPSTLRPASGPAGKFAAATRPIIDPTTGKSLYDSPVVRNPVVRARKNMTEGMLAKLPEGNYMAPTRRGARLGEAESRRTARRAAANLDRSYLNVYKKLSTDEKDALVYMAQGFNTADRARRLLEARRERIAEVSATTAQGAERAKRGADTTDLVRDAKVIQRVLPLIERPTPGLQEALKAQRAVNDVTQATFVRNMIREGTTQEAAEARIIERAQMPLRLVGINPAEGEVPMILTHIEDAAKRGKRGQDLEHGMTLRMLDEERETTGANFLNARYERDASMVLTTHRLMFAKEQTHMRIERAISKAEPYDRVKHANLVSSGKLRWVQKNDPLVKDANYIETSLNRFEKDLGDFTDAEVEALRDAYNAMFDLVEKEGSPGLVLPTAHYQELVSQFKNGRGILEKITDGVGKLTKPWRHIVLSLKGSFYVNNFIGNLFLGIVAYGPRYILDVAQESLPKAMRGATSARITSDVSDLERTAGARNVADMSKAARIDVFSRVGEKVAAQGVKLTEDNFRRAALRANLRKKVNEYRAAQPGMTRHEAVEAVFNDKRAVDQLAEATYGDLLDYSKLTPLERELLIPAMPFWNFTRAMTGRTIRLTLDEPWKLRVLLYFGDHGIEANLAQLPEGVTLPEYLKGMILSDKTGETPRVLSTYGMNPFVAPVDLAAQLMSFFGDTEGSMNPLASFNPLWKVPLEAVINRDLFMDSEIRSPSGEYPKSAGGRMLVQAKKNIPQIAMLERYRYPGKYPAIERDGSDTIAQYLGAPIGTLRPDNIERVNEIVAAMKARDEAYREKQREGIAERARF